MHTILGVLAHRQSISAHPSRMKLVSQTIKTGTSAYSASPSTTDR
ncbi:hypothetical protein HMPREF9612_00018 [Cutibacterium acnes HL063PA2]|nr:hypothetical protein HMPREF9612_00018 [Cutibacterium acnes HL063PA2]EGF04704.1 hypothetical protein HMPREF9586_00149 [Cutibacterium acnes HL083PA2]EGF71208.1 hypothetical protein HMPREF9588_01220 [Cutibacterium acnes HL025PA2]